MVNCRFLFWIDYKKKFFVNIINYYKSIRKVSKIRNQSERYQRLEIN